MKNQIKKKIILKLNPDKQTAIKSKRRQSDIKKEKKKKKLKWEGNTYTQIENNRKSPMTMWDRVETRQSRE